MVERTLIIREVARKTDSGVVDSLHFEPGVNVLVGDHNTGKTRWLQTIDYLLGDDLSKEEREHGIIYQKYQSVYMKAQLAGEQIEVERRWKHGVGSKVIVNGSAVTLDGYRPLLAERLGIPAVLYPLGNPYKESSWRVIGWRSLCRHIYRWQDGGWGELVPKQPLQEQHAALMQFLGVAEQMFSSDAGVIAEHKTELAKLQWQREQYVSMLQDMSKDLIDAQEPGVALTPQSIEEAISRLQREEEEAQAKRSELLRSLRSDAQQSSPGLGKEAVTQLMDELIQRQNTYESICSAEKKASGRLSELVTYRQMLADEAVRMRRVYEAGEVLSDLRVTHCPACDQEVHRLPSSHSSCYLCGQHKDECNALPDRRIEFELEQLTTERDEVDELISTLQDEIGKLTGQAKYNRDEQEQIRQALRPIRTSAAAILPPELAVMDINSGRRFERIRQLLSFV